MTDENFAESPLGHLVRDRIDTLQVNIGKRCNLACHHCHVESTPKRREKLSPEGCARILELLAANPEVRTLDLTGGAPELHEGFRDLVRGARALGRRVIDRCNLTVFFEAGQEDTAEFLADQGVEIVASLPCYTPENLEAQRGRGTFAASIEALGRLNALGYGRGDPARVLDLVYNPLGAQLPPGQAELEAEYRVRLAEDFGVRFDSSVAAPLRVRPRQDGRVLGCERLQREHGNDPLVHDKLCAPMVTRREIQLPCVAEANRHGAR